VGDEADLNIYSSGLELVYSGKKEVKLSRFNTFREVILYNTEIDFPSGVYIYIIKSGEDVFKGKLVIFND
jgi:hypothetical protein